MPYLNCPACGLTLAPRGLRAPLETCPRCHARRGEAVKLRDLAGVGASGRAPAAETVGKTLRPGPRPAQRPASV